MSINTVDITESHYARWPTKSEREISAWAIGLTWSLMRTIEQYADFEHVSFKRGAAGGADREDEKVFLIRTQVSF